MVIGGPEGLLNELDLAGTNVPAGSNSSIRHVTSPTQRLLSRSGANLERLEGLRGLRSGPGSAFPSKRGILREFSCFLLRTVRCGRAAPLRGLFLCFGGLYHFVYGVKGRMTGLRGQFQVFL